MNRGVSHGGAARTAAYVLSVVLVVYLALMSSRAMTLIMTARPLLILFGLALLVLPVLGALLVFDQLRFGRRAARLARRLADEGGLVETSHLPRRPSGRVRLEAADAWFEERKAELDEDPQDWRRWFRLAEAYDLAGDRNRGRKAMRTAIDLERAGGE